MSIVHRGLSFLAIASTLLAETRLHHIHLRATNPPAVVDFYASRLGAQRKQVLGADAAETGRGALIVSPATEIRAGQTALWHLGWGALDIRAEYIRQLDLGTVFSHPLEYLIRDAFFAYLKAPHEVEVEIMPMKTAGFGHIHLYSLHPHVAGEWYARYIGLKPTRPLSAAPVQVGRYTVSSAAYLDAGGVSFLVFPKPGEVADLLPSEGSAMDHLAFAVDNLDARLLDIRKSGARILEMPRGIAPGVRAAMVQGPDRMKIELIEER